MRRNAVGLVWLAGIVLAVVVYRIGPDRIVFTAADMIDEVRLSFGRVLALFAIDTFELMRALTVGLLPAFVGLCLLASRRGVRAGRLLVMVAVLELLLLYQPIRDGFYISSARWTVAFVIVLIGCAIVTRRIAGESGAGPWRTPAPR